MLLKKAEKKEIEKKISILHKSTLFQQVGATNEFDSYSHELLINQMGSWKKKKKSCCVTIFTAHIKRAFRKISNK